MSPANKQSTLSAPVRIAAVLLVVSLGLWGCSRKSSPKVATTDRARALEGRCVKLEQDYRTVQQARDKAKKELTSLEEETSRLQKELTTIAELAKERDDLKSQVKSIQTESEQIRQVLGQRTNERDELKQQVSLRLTERDTLHSRCERLRKGLQSLMTQDDTPNGAIPVMAPATPTAGGPPASGPNVGGQS